MIARRGAAAILLAGVTGLAIVVADLWPVAAAQGSSGRVSGHVRLTTAGRVPSGASVYSRRAVGPRAKAQPEVVNVVVFFADVPAPSDVKATRAAIGQKDEQFVPHLVAVTTGSTVDFPNRDPFFHNVFSLSRPANFDLGRYPSGATRGQQFRKPGIVKVYCHFHSHMSAVVRIFDHAWFTLPDNGGLFSIDGVPPGEHTLVAWHERIGERRDRVTIRAGATTNVSFTLPVLEPAP